MDADRRSRSSSEGEGEKTDSSNLRDLLRMKEEDGGNGRCRLTLSDVLGAGKRQPVQPTRTLLDIIRNDAVSGDRDGRNSWRQLREKLRLQRAGAGASCISSVQVSASGLPVQQCSNLPLARHRSAEFGTTSVSNPEDNPSTESTQPVMSLVSNNGGDRLGELDRIPSGTVTNQSNTNGGVTVSEIAEQNRRTSGSRVPEPADRNQAALETTATESAGLNQRTTSYAAAENARTAEEREEHPVRMSLMALLSEAEGQMRMDGSVYAMEEEDGKEKRNGAYNNCCVCMVRNKGAAFIPCGHTFCRLCCRELWVQRGSCPLCNGFILEVLDIF